MTDEEASNKLLLKMIKTQSQMQINPSNNNTMSANSYEDELELQNKMKKMKEFSCEQHDKVISLKHEIENLIDHKHELGISSEESSSHDLELSPHS